MSGLLAAFFSSFIVTLLIIRYEHLHGHLSGDSDLTGPQKFHNSSVPRIGGISIALGLLSAVILRFWLNPKSMVEPTLLLCSIPVFAIGLTEDLTKSISIKARLFFTAIGAFFATQLLGIQITHLDLPGVDFLLSLYPLSVVFTVFAITGLSNAYNIIDGFNGLASMVGIITLLALGYMGYVVGDTLIIFSSFIMAAAILGFFLWNYPRGSIFLGDGGAYLIGFWIALISILLTLRHPNVSPWFALMVNGYPIIETLFTIYRRKVHQGKSPGQPDGIHFHSLVFRRLLMSACNKNNVNRISANARTSPYLWIFTTLAVVPAIFWWNSTYILAGLFIAYFLIYAWIYKKIINFKTPKWLFRIIQ